MLESCWVSTCTQRLAWWAENPSLISFTDCLFTSFEAAQSSRTVRELLPSKVHTYHFQSKCNPVLLADDCRSLSAKWSRGFKWMLGRWVQHNQTCHRRGRSSSLQTADVFPVIPPKISFFGGTTRNMSAVRRLPQFWFTRNCIIPQLVGSTMRALNRILPRSMLEQSIYFGCKL